MPVSYFPSAENRLRTVYMDNLRHPFVRIETSRHSVLWDGDVFMWIFARVHLLSIKKNMKRIYMINGALAMRKAGIMLVLALAGMVGWGCSDDDDPASYEENGPEGVEFPGMPTTDQLDVKSSLPAYVWGGTGSYQDYGAALVNRLTVQQELSNDVVAVVIKGSDVAGLTLSETEQILRIGVRGGNIVLVSPTRSEWDAFGEKIFEAIKDEAFDTELRDTSLWGGFYKLMKNMVEMVQEVEGADSFIHIDETHSDHAIYDAVAFRNNNYFLSTVLDNPDMPNDTVRIADVEVNEQGETVGDTIYSEEVMPKAPVTAYDYGVKADLLIQWINGAEGDRARKEALMARGKMLMAAAGVETRAGGAEDLTKLMEAQQVDYDFSINQSDPLYHRLPVHVKYYIWSVCDIDKKEDYYIVQQDITAYNENLDCGPSNKKYGYIHKVSGAEWLYYGSFMKNLHSRNWLANAELLKFSPQTQNGSISYSEGFSWNLGGNLGFNMSGLTGGVSSGISYSSSSSRSVADLSTTYEASNNQWQYYGNTPSWHHPFFKDFYHDDAAAILRTTCQVSNYWIWKIKNATGEYEFKSEIGGEIGGVSTHNWKYRSKRYSAENKKSFSIRMDPPSRYVSTWGMVIEYPADYDEKKRNAMREKLKNLFPSYWDESMKIYTVERDATKAAEDMFDSAMSALERDKTFIKNEGFTGTFTFYIRNRDTGIDLTRKTVIIE